MIDLSAWMLRCWRVSICSPALFLVLWAPASASPLPVGLGVDFGFGALSSPAGGFVAPDTYDFSIGGLSGAAAGASGSFADDSEILAFALSGSFDGDTTNVFTAPLTLSFSNSTASSDFIITLDPSITVTATHSGLGLNSVALTVDGGLTPIDSVEADDPVFGFGLGDAIDEALDLSSLSAITVGAGATVDLLLTLTLDQTHTGFFGGPEVSDYDITGAIGLASIAETAAPIPVPGAIWLMATGLAGLAWRARKRLRV